MKKLKKEARVARVHDVPFTFTHPFADQVGTAHAEECALGLCRNRLGQITLTRSRRAVQQYALPGLPLPLEQVRKLDGQQYGLLQRLLGTFETSNIVPFDVGPVLQNGARECATQLLAVLVERSALAVLAVLALACAAGRGAVSADHAGFLALGVGVGEVRFELLGAIHVLAGLLPDHLLGLWVLLPLQRQHEELEGGVVHLVGVLVLCGIVSLDGFAHRLDCAAEEIGVGHGGRIGR